MAAAMSQWRRLPPEGRGGELCLTAGG